MASAHPGGHPALRDVVHQPFWLDSPARPDTLPPVSADLTTDLIVVGGGYSGLWTALLAKQRNPGRDVVLLEGNRIAWSASGRNGGFCDASLTHGADNGAARFPGELVELDRLGRDNFAALERTIRECGIDCDFVVSGSIDVATQPHQVPWLRDAARTAQELGHDAVLLDAAELRAEIDSPTYLGGLWHRDDCAILDPAKLAWGLQAQCAAMGVRMFEHSAVTDVRPDGAGVCAAVGDHTIRAQRIALGINAFRPLLRPMRNFVTAVYDYALMTEPLTPAQRASIGWAHQQGIGDTSNQFHYYRPTADGRILWGGYDAIYHYGGRVDPAYDTRQATFEVLARHFLATFPQLEGLRFTHAWGGAIDTSTRFFAYQRLALGGRAAYSQGFTGLGVAATRFGAEVMLDLLDGVDSPALRLNAIRSRPLPFPPEPLRYLGIQLTRHELARADRNAGRRGPWLSMLDKAGLGFDS